MPKAKTFQELILTLQNYWAAQGCLILQPYDDQMGAGTFHPATTLRALGPRPWKAAFVQPSRRPSDGRYGVTRAWHDFQRAELSRDLSPATRPIVYNSWMATTFDVSLEQQTKLAREAAALGVETFVLDDGWFAGRDSDRAGLGDWRADPFDVGRLRRAVIPARR